MIETNLDDIILLHLQRLGSLIVVDAPAVEQEAEGCDGNTNLAQWALLHWEIKVDPNKVNTDYIDILFHSEKNQN